MDALTIIVPLVTAILTAFVTHYLTRSHYEKKRQDDLADRDFARRAAIHDMRIKEAREFVNTLHDTFDLKGRVTTILRGPEDITPSDAKEMADLLVQIGDLKNKSASHLSDIDVLGDAKLKSLYDEIHSISQTNPLGALALTIVKGGRSEGEVEAVEKMADAFAEAEAKIVEMKNRIDEIAKTVP